MPNAAHDHRHCFRWRTGVLASAAPASQCAAIERPCPPALDVAQHRGGDTTCASVPRVRGERLPELSPPPATFATGAPGAPSFCSGPATSRSRSGDLVAAGATMQKRGAGSSSPGSRSDSRDGERARTALVIDPRLGATGLGGNASRSRAAAHCEAGAADAKTPVRHRKRVSAGGREQRWARPLHAFTVTQVRWPLRSEIACAITGAAVPLRCLPASGTPGRAERLGQA